MNNINFIEKFSCFCLSILTVGMVIFAISFTQKNQSFLKLNLQEEIFVKPKINEEQKTSESLNDNLSNKNLSLNASTQNIKSPSLEKNISLPSLSTSSEFLANQNFSSNISFDTSFSKQNIDFETDIFELDQLDKIPSLIKKPITSYPKNLLERRIEGSVKLLILIDENGKVKVKKVIFSSHSDFTKEAIKAIEKSIYSSPTRNQKKVKSIFTITIPFYIYE